MLREQQTSNWVLDRNSGTYILVTPANRQLYGNALRYIIIEDMPVPADTQQVIKILDDQYDRGIKTGDFTAEDVERASSGLTSRRFARGQAQSQTVINEPEAPNVGGHPDPMEHLDAEPDVDQIFDTINHESITPEREMAKSRQKVAAKKAPKRAAKKK
jgi:hypothetical protein